VKLVSVKIDAAEIFDWDSFHTVFAKVMGFPDFYGKNLNAWIDCMSYLDDPGAGMTNVCVSADEICMIEFDSAQSLSKDHPQSLSALVECVAAVNQRAKLAGRVPLLALAFS
jgi:hypothetical protein